MADGCIEWSEEPRVGGRQDNGTAAGPKMRGGQFQFSAIILDVLQNIDVNDRVEPPVAVDRPQGPADRFVVPARRRSEFHAELVQKTRVRLETHPSTGATRTHELRVRSGARTHFQDVA